MSGKNENFVLSLCTKTWIRDSHGLYDYESNQTKNLNAVLAESIYIGRKKHDIKTLNSPNDLKQDEELLFNVKNDYKDEYALENEVPIRIQPTEKNINDLSNKIWYVLKNDPNQSNQSNPSQEYGELTGTAAKELEFVVKDIVLANQDRFVKFYNDAGPISIKKHLLEELPGLGKKTVTEILNARKAGPFKDFEDLKTRVPMLKDPVKLIVDRIILEISDRERRHYIFIVR